MYTKDFIEKIISDNKNEKVVILLEGSKSNGLASSSSNSIVIHPNKNGQEWETLNFKIENDVIYVENKRTIQQHGSLSVKTHIKQYAFLKQVIGVNVLIRDF